MRLLLVILSLFFVKNISAQGKLSMFRGNAQLTGFYDTKAVTGLKNVKFTFKTEGPIRSTPAIADGVIYVGSGDGNLYAISTEGKELWRFTTGGAIHSSPAILNGVAYFASRDGIFYALQTSTGKELWKYKMGKDLPYNNGWDYYLSSPTIVDNNIYIGSGDGFMYAFDLKTKQPVWKFNAGSRIRTTPAVINNQLLFGTMDGHLYCIQKDKGIQQWKFATKGTTLKFADFGFDATAILCSPSVSSGIVTVGARDGFMYTIDLATGKEKWKLDHEGSWVLGTAIKNETVFVASGSSAFVQAVDATTGTEKWRFKTLAAVFSSIAIAEEVVYFDDYLGNVYALDAGNGKQLWHFPMGNRALGSPAIANGIVYCGNDDGILFALEGSNEPHVKPAPKKVVYWEADRSDKEYKWYQPGLDMFVRNYFKNSGYEVAGAKQLEEFMKTSIAERSASVVVFASSNVPDNVAGNETDKALIRRYLDAGGKVVFLTPNPLAYYFNAATGELDSVNFQTRPKKILDVQFNAPGNINGGSVYSSTVTDAGRKLGLRNVGVACGYVDPAQVSTVLAVNEYGMASAWIKNYGGPEGTGLVQFSVWKNPSARELDAIKSVIEFGISW